MPDLVTSGGEATAAAEAAATESTNTLDNSAAEATSDKTDATSSAKVEEVATSTDTTTTDKTDDGDKDTKEDIPKLMSQAQIDKIVSGRYNENFEKKVAAKAAELSKEALASSDELKKENNTLRQELESFKLAAQHGLSESLLLKSKLQGKELEELALELVAERKGWGFKAPSKEQTLADKMNESVSTSNTDSFAEARLAKLKGAL